MDIITYALCMKNDKAIIDLVQSLPRLTSVVVDEPPTVETAEPNKLYLVDTNEDRMYEAYLLAEIQGEEQVIELGPIIDLSDYYTKTEIGTLLDTKQDILTWDVTVTQNSNNAVTSGVVFTAVSDLVKSITKLNDGNYKITKFNGTEATITTDATVTQNSKNLVQSGGVYTAISNAVSALDERISYLQSDVSYLNSSVNYLSSDILPDLSSAVNYMQSEIPLLQSDVAGLKAKDYIGRAWYDYNDEPCGEIFNYYEKNNGEYIQVATGAHSHAEGYQTSATERESHAEGYSTIASGIRSHAENNQTQAVAPGTHAEGYGAIAAGYYSHVEGYNSKTNGEKSHAEGSSIANGDHSHAEGISIANGSSSHSSGNRTIANTDYSTVIGTYNVEDTLNNTITFNNYNQAQKYYTTKEYYKVEVTQDNKVSYVKTETFTDVIILTPKDIQDASHIKITCNPSHEPSSGDKDYAYCYLINSSNTILDYVVYEQDQHAVTSAVMDIDITSNVQEIIIQCGYGTISIQCTKAGNGEHLFIIGNGTGIADRSNIVEVNSTELNVNGDIKQNGTAIAALAFKSSATGTAVTNVVYDSTNERLVIEVGTVTVS